MKTKNNLYSLQFVLLSLLFCSNMYGQLPSQDSLQAQIARYNEVHPRDVLYIATDKEVYLPEETIWFAGYLLEITTKADSLKPDLLSVALLREDSTDVSIRKNYLIADGFCSGSLGLPENLAPGTYLLTGNTNLVDKEGEPVHVFRKEISIKTEKISALTVDFQIAEGRSTDSVFIDAKVYFPEGISASERNKATITYHLQDGELRKTKLDDLGTAIIGLSRSELQKTNYILYTTTSFGVETRKLDIQLPVDEPENREIRFYPEGGEMVAGLPGRIAWEARLPDGRPLETTALLLNNSTVTDTVETDSQGFGEFELLPTSHSKFSLRVPEGNEPSAWKTYPLPEVVSSGVTVNIPSAVSGDTLNVRIQTKQQELIRIAVTSAYTGETMLTPAIPVNHERQIDFLLNEVSKGLNTLTILDNQGQIRAKRLFFAHFNQRNKVSIETDKENYNLREKVIVELGLSDASDRPLNGVFSVSCVQVNRLTTPRKLDIGSYFYTKPLLDMEVERQENSTRLYHNKSDLEKRLLMNTREAELLKNRKQPESGNRIHGLEKLKLNGRIKQEDGYELEDSYELLVNRDSLWYLIPTDEKGGFSPRPEEIVVSEDGYTQVRVMKKDRTVSDVYLLIDDPMEELNRHVIEMPWEYAAGDLSLQNSRDYTVEIPRDRSITELGTVHLSAVNRSRGYAYRANECGDYVCEKNILNCKIMHSAFSPGNTLPKDGKEYKVVVGNGQPPEFVRYEGCVWEGDKLHVFTAREFRGMDKNKVEDTFEKHYMSTIYWEAFKTLSGEETGMVEFYTSDLPGTYKIRVEGIAENGEFLYAEKLISVEQK